MFKKITDSIYAIDDGTTIGNVGMISTENGNFVIDTSMYPVMARDIRTAVNNTGTGNLLASFFTHYHFDHTAGNQHFSDAPMYAHQILQDNFMTNYKSKEEEIIQNFRQRDNDGHLFEGLDVTSMTKIFDTVTLTPEEDSSIELIHVGGHTTGSTIIYYKPENVLFAGDNIFAGYYPGGHDPSSDPYQWHNALKQMKSLDPSIVVPGHGSVHEGTGEITKLADYLSKFIGLGAKLTEEGTTKEIALEQLGEIAYYEELFPTMKERTMNNWYSVISRHNSTL